MNKFLILSAALLGTALFTSDAAAQCRNNFNYGNRGFYNSRPAVSVGYSRVSGYRPAVSFGYSSGFGSYGVPVRTLPYGYGGYGYRPSPYYRVPAGRPPYGRTYGRSGVSFSFGF